MQDFSFTFEHYSAQLNIAAAPPIATSTPMELDALATSTGYAGRRPLPWLACNVARAILLDGDITALH